MDQLKHLQIRKKEIQSSKNPLGHYSMAQKFELIKINDQIKEIKRGIQMQKDYNALYKKPRSLGPTIQK